MYRGVDVSFHKGYPNWTAAKDSGMVQFAILGVTQLYGKDASFEHNYKGCLDNGIPIGLYKFSYARSVEQSRAEANDIVAILQGRSIQMGVWLDLEWETQQGFGEQRLGAIIEAFREGIEAGGYKFAGIYCNQYWYNTFIPTYAKDKYKFWIASYSYEPRGVKSLAGWQFTEGGEVPGFGGQYVDLDEWYDEIGENPLAGIEDVIVYPTVTIPTVALGSSGIFVKLLQAKLNRSLGTNLVIDGDFGPLTKQAVEQYQAKKGLAVDGIVGPLTWHELTVGDVHGKTVAELGYEIICGFYGNGETRKQLLAKDGYHNYEEIQNIVNQLLA